MNVNDPNYIKKVLSPENSSIELQNAYRMIERLQKTVKNYQGNQSFHVTAAKIVELENKIKKVTDEEEQYKLELKYVKKELKDKEKHIIDL